jgi:hypothetical protein
MLPLYEVTETARRGVMKGLARIAFSVGVLLFALPVWAQEIGSRGERGTISGVVMDLATSQPLSDAVVVVTGTSERARTDAEGRFSLSLPPGTYELRISREGYREEVVSAVSVRGGEVSWVEIALGPIGLTLGEVEVRARDGDARLSILEERRAASAVSEIISAEEMRRDVRSDAASVLSRSVGLSVVQNKYVYVRGLGERYSHTMLDGATLPTPEPDRRVVPLDLIPANLLREVHVVKSFTPDQPGEFSGGIVRLQTQDFPSAGTLAIGFSTGGNSQTTLRPFLTYPGGRWDGLGFGSGARRLPAIIPDEAVISGRFSPTELQTFGRAFRNVWEPRSRRAIPNQGLAISGGGNFGRWGIVGSLSFSRTFRSRRIASFISSGLEDDPFREASSRTPNSCAGAACSSASGSRSRRAWI